MTSMQERAVAKYGDHVKYGCTDCDWTTEGVLERPGLHDGDVLRAVERHERRAGHCVDQVG